MAKKPYKTIEQENGSLSIYGNNHWIEVGYEKPDWSEEEEACFKYKGNTYYLSEFMRIEDNKYPDWLSEFHGIRSDSYFSGVLVKLHDTGDAVKAYTYY